MLNVSLGHISNGSLNQIRFILAHVICIFVTQITLGRSYVSDKRGRIKLAWTNFKFRTWSILF